MITRVRNILAHTPAPEITLPGGKALYTPGINVGYKLSRTGNNGIIAMIPLLTWEKDGEQFKICHIEFPYEIETDGSLDDENLYKLIVYSLNLFKNAIAIHPLGPDVRPQDIPIQSKEEFRPSLNYLIELWDEAPPHA